MVTTFGDFDVGLMLGSGDDARSEVVVQERRWLSGRTLRSPCTAVNDALHFASADDGVDFRDLFEDLIAEPFDETAGNDEFLGSAELLVLGHFQDGLRWILFVPTR